MKWINVKLTKLDSIKLRWRSRLLQLHRRCKDFILDHRVQGSIIQIILNKVLEDSNLQILLLKVLIIKQLLTNCTTKEKAT